VRRRSLVALISAAVVGSWPIAALPQGSAKTFRLGILQGGTREDVQSFSEEPFLSELVQLGYVEGKNLTIERRYADGRLDRLPVLAAEIIAFRPDLIFAPPAPAAAAAKQLTTTVPIVFCFVNEPVALGLAQSLAHPGGNLTGTSNFSVEIAAKRIELLRELVPGLVRLAAWYNPQAVSDAIEVPAVEKAAAGLRMEFLPVKANVPAEYDAAAEATRNWGAHAMYISSNPSAYASRKQIIALAAAMKLPTTYFHAAFVADGGLMSYATNFPDLARRAAGYAARILQGANPADLPIEQPTRIDLSINLKTARALGLVIPESLMLRATALIDE